MKKKLSVLCAVLLCLLLAAGCTNKAEEDAGLAALQKIIRGSGGTVGIAFLGYTDSEGTEETLKSLVKESACVRSYPFLSETGVVAYEGAEVFALVPGGNDCRITVCKAGITEEGTYIDWTDEVIYEGRPGEAVILRCNLSEIHANVLISVTDGTETLEFHPMLSMMDGHVAAEPGCYDFTDYEMTEEERAQDASDLLTATDEVKDALERGMKLLYTGDTQTIEGRPCLLFALGTDREDQFVREQLYAVSDNLIYVFDTETDQWQVLGAE